MRVVLAVAVCACLCGVALGAGGGDCLVDVHCGWPDGSASTTREAASSLTGSCQNSQCSCTTGYECDRCTFVKENSFNTLIAVTGGGSLDACSISWGYGICETDKHCGDHGLCIDNHCVCDKDYACEYCTMNLQSDLKQGALCGQYVTGRGGCTTASDCGTGACLQGQCVCPSGRTCPHCERTLEGVRDNGEECSCTNVNCNGHGFCVKGICRCDAGWSTPDCSYNPCVGKECSGHGTCDSATGRCVCNEGYLGDDCENGGATCTDCVDCGGVVDWVADPTGRTFNCGGACVNSTCVCYPTFTCNRCQAQGDTCDHQARSGGECSLDAHCGNGGGTCVQGTCQCFNGFWCAWCSARTNTLSCPLVNPNAAITSAAAHAMPGLVSVLCLAVSVSALLFL